MDKIKFPYQVRVTARERMNYDKQTGLLASWLWARKTFGDPLPGNANGVWVFDTQTTYHFSHSKDANWFALRWA